MKTYFSYEDPILDSIKSYLFYSSIKEHFKKEKRYSIYKHLHSKEAWFSLYQDHTFKIIT